MKKNLSFLFLSVLIALSARAQKANMIFFSQNEEKFYLVVNGIQQNAEPLSNVKITEMAAPMQYRVRIKFADSKLGILDDKVSVLPDEEKTWTVQHAKKKTPAGSVYIIRVAGQVPIASLPPNSTLPPGQIIVYHTEPLPSVGSDGVSFNMNVNDQGANVNLNTGGGASNGHIATTTTSTSTTHYGEQMNTTIAGGTSGCTNPLNAIDFRKKLSRVTTQTTASGKKIIANKIAQAYCLTSRQVYELCNAITFSNDKLELAKFCYHKCFDPQNYEEVYKAFPLSSAVKELDDYISMTSVYQDTTPVPAAEIYVPGYEGQVGCAFPMSSSSFASAKTAIAESNFENTKLSTAKTIVGANCVTADQVATICKLFDFEDTKLQFAKFAYAKTYDKGNYFKINSVFDFDASKETMNKFVQNGGK